MKFKESPLKDAYRLGLWFGVRPSLRALPPGHEFQVFRTMGRQAARLPGATRQLVEDNLSRVYPPGEQRDALVVKAFEEHFSTQYVSFTFPRIADHNRDHYIRLPGYASRACCPPRSSTARVSCARCCATCSRAARC